MEYIWQRNECIIIIEWVELCIVVVSLLWKKAKIGFS